jgi:hypothetical protein
LIVSEPARVRGAAIKAELSGSIKSAIRNPQSAIRVFPIRGVAVILTPSRTP